MGVQINGDTGNISATKADYSGNVTICGTLTYEDVTNIDSVGLVTARSGIEVGARPGVAASISVDGNMIVSGISTFGGDIKTSGSNIILGDSGGSNDDRIKLGASGDLAMYHDGSNSYIEDSGTGKLNILSSQAQILNPAANEAMAKFIENGAVELYHDNSKKLETASGGVTVTGTVAATSFTGSGAALTGISAGVLAMQLRLDGTRGSYTETITSGNSFTSGRNLSGLSITMTPTNATTIFLITGNIYATHSPSYMGKGFVTTEISGGSEEVIAGNGDNNHRATFPISDAEYGTGWTGTGKTFTLFYDHNTTSAVTFRVRVATTHGGYPVKYNQDGESNTTDNDGVSMISSFMVQEIDSSIFTGTDNANIYRGT